MMARAVEPPGSAADLRRALVQRVNESSGFRRSRRLQDLLLYLVEHTEGDTTALDDAAIAADVLERSDFDESAAGLVRAQVSLLRKKLAEYFDGEGAHEPLVIEVALVTYQPVFRSREVARPDAAADAPRPAQHLLVATGVLLLAAVAWLVGARMPDGRPSALPQRPHVDELWRQMFDNRRHTSIVMADSGLPLMQDLLGSQIPLADYRQDRLVAINEERVQPVESRRLFGRMLYQRQTPMADVILASRSQQILAALGLSADAVLARVATRPLLETDNVILSGPRRANPWLELLEPRLNFTSRFDEASRTAFLDNRHPDPGEAPTYVVRWGEQGYCRVAYLPGLNGAGTVLIVSGTDMGSTEAGADFITSEHWVQELRSRLGAREREPWPYFEVLLGTSLVTTTSSAPELIAVRRPSRTFDAKAP
jgi:hypothetical protein